MFRSIAQRGRNHHGYPPRAGSGVSANGSLDRSKEALPIGARRRKTPRFCAARIGGDQRIGAFGRGSRRREALRLQPNYRRLLCRGRALGRRHCRRKSDGYFEGVRQQAENPSECRPRMALGGANAAGLSPRNSHASATIRARNRGADHGRSSRLRIDSTTGDSRGKPRS